MPVPGCVIPETSRLDRSVKVDQKSMMVEVGAGVDGGASSTILEWVDSRRNTQHFRSELARLGFSEESPPSSIQTLS